MVLLLMGKAIAHDGVQAQAPRSTSIGNKYNVFPIFSAKGRVVMILYENRGFVQRGPSLEGGSLWSSLRPRQSPRGQTILSLTP